MKRGRSAFHLDFQKDNQSEDATIVSRKWKKIENGVETIFDANNNSNASTTLNAIPTTIILTVTDDVGRADSEEKEIAVDLPLPGWREVPPIIP